MLNREELDKAYTTLRSLIDSIPVELSRLEDKEKELLYREEQLKEYEVQLEGQSKALHEERTAFKKEQEDIAEEKSVIEERSKSLAIEEKRLDGKKQEILDMLDSLEKKELSVQKVVAKAKDLEEKEKDLKERERINASLAASLKEKQATLEIHEEGLKRKSESLQRMINAAK